jgi:hypothetical protein
MAYNMATYTPVGSDYTVVARTDTQLIIECQVDKKVIMKRLLGTCIAPIIILSVYCAVLLVILGIPIGMSSFSPVSLLLPVMIIIIALVIPATLNSTVSKMARPFTVELDKVANKVHVCMPNPYLTNNPRGTWGRGAYARLGQYFTLTWDLDKVMFQGFLAGEYTGPGSFTVRTSFKNMYLISLTTTTVAYPNVLFATGRAELAQSLVGEIDRFFGTAGRYNWGSQGGGNEQPYSGRPGEYPGSR